MIFQFVLGRRHVTADERIVELRDELEMALDVARAAGR
jgi:hypothetical protein